MLKHIKPYLSSLILILFLIPAHAAALEIGKPAPNFTATDSNGNTHQLSDFKGKVVVLEWTNHECPFVRKHYDSKNMQNLQKAYTAKDVTWFTILSSAPDKQGYLTGEQFNTLIEQEGAAPTAALLDPTGKVGKLYDAKTTPQMVIIDTNGSLVYMGAIDDKPTTKIADIDTASNYVSAALDELLAGKTVTTTITKPYGCGVKYPS